MDTSKLLGAVVLTILAGVLWLTLVRRGADETALATILSKDHVAATTYMQQPIGDNRGFREPTAIPIAESYAFALRLDGVADPARVSFNIVKSRRFDVGQRVRVQFARRGIPPLWTSVVVTDMTPADPR